MRQATCATLWALLSTAVAVPTAAQDFRVESQVYLNGTKTPMAEQLTLFHGERVYDFNLRGLGQGEITLLDLQDGQGKIVLLDVNRRQKAEISTSQLLDFCAQIKAIGSKESAPDEHLFSPKFTTTVHQDQKVVELVGRRITYRVSGLEPRESKSVARYHEFADWYARLNSLRPGSLPPFGRLEVNRVLAEQGWLPERIERTIVLDLTFGGKQTARSQHVIDWMLSNTDRRRIQDVGGYLASFSQVSLQDYLQVDSVAKK